MQAPILYGMFESSLLYRAFRRITLIINQQMHLYKMLY